MITAFQQKRGFVWAYALNGSAAVFGILTLFGPLFPLFCDSMGFSKTKIGFILGLMPLFYVFSVLLSGWIAKYGSKKIFLRCFFIRYFFAIGIPFTVIVNRSYGTNAAFLWITFCIVCFGILRVIGETAYLAWWIDLIPKKSRGTIEALNSTIANFLSIIASLGAVMLIVKQQDDFSSISLIMYIGVIIGFVGLAAALRMPGGNPAILLEKREMDIISEISAAFREPRFRLWLKGTAFFIFAISFSGFFSLFLRERLDLAFSTVMFLSVCFQLGAAISAFFWGWSADRFGSPAIFLNAQIGLCLVPVFFFLLPGLQQGVLVIAILYFFFGVVCQGWISGSSKYFYVEVLSQSKNARFLSGLNLMCGNLIMAAGAFIYGWLLDSLQFIDFQWGFLVVNNFSIMFCVMFFFFVFSILVMRKAVASEEGVQARQFMSFFFEGSPLLAFSSMLRYNVSIDESRRMENTRRMGDSKNRMSVRELIQAVDDPNFNVRYEAIISIARMPPDDKLIDTLCDVVKSREPGLSEAAVWALGRMNATRALPVLREMLKCEYALLRSQCARALGKLHDQQSVPEIIAGLKSERDGNIAASYAAALGRLNRREMTPDLLALLRRLDDDRLRGEVALALSRLIAEERRFVDLWRRSRFDFETTCAETLLKIGKKINLRNSETENVRVLISRCSGIFERHDVESGVVVLNEIINLVIKTEKDPVVNDILGACVEFLSIYKESNSVYILLALNTLMKI